MMNLYGLRYYYDTCRLKSMSEAAQLNRVSRSAISQAIKKLESDLGTKLLNHKRRGLELAPKGLILFHRAESIFAELEKAESLLKQDDGILQGSLTIGAAQAPASFLLQGVLTKLRSAHPALRIKVRVYSSQALIKKLANREIDLAFFLGDETLPNHNSIVLRKGHFKLLRPKSLTTKNASYAITESRSETARARDLFRRKFASDLPIYAEVASWDAIWTWMNEGLCGGLVPDFLFARKRSVSRNFQVILDNVWTYEIKAIFPASRKEDPALLAFVKALGK